MESKKWSYWNFLSELIPEDVEALPDIQKLKLLHQWDELTVTKNVQSIAAKLHNIRDLPHVGLQL